MIAEPAIKSEPVTLARRPFNFEEYQRLSELGIIGNDERIELIGGELVEMSPINIGHVLCVNRLNNLLAVLLAGRAILSIQNPVRLGDRTVPQPDVALWRIREDQYAGRIAHAEDLLLVIEVADSSLDYDRKVKAHVYASAGIQEYWIVNLPGRMIEVYREPRADGYRTTARYSSGDAIALLAFPDITLAADDILG